MVPDRQKVWMDGIDGRTHGRHQNYIPPTSSEIKSSENDQLTGHFQRFFFRAFFFNISRKNSKTSQVDLQSVLNLYIFPHFPKILDRAITFNSVTLKNTQTEPQKYIIFFN